MAVRGIGKNGYVAVGFSSGQAAMAGSDAVIGWVYPNGSASVR